MSNMKKMKKYSRLISLAGLFLIDESFFSQTNPHTITAIGLIIGYLIVMANIYWLITTFIVIYNLYFPRIMSPRQKNHVNITNLLMVIIGLSIGLLTIGQLTLTRFLIIFIVLTSIYSYLYFMKYKMRPQPKKK